jgi:hypothetical protein
VNPNLILLIVAAVLSLPGGLFVSFLMSEPRAKWLSLIGAVIGAGATGAAIYYYITAANPSLDSLSFGLGSFFGCSMGAFTGALVINFLVGLSSRPPETSSEF